MQELATSDETDAQCFGEEAEEFCELLAAMLEFPKPLIAAVNGPALASGACAGAGVRRDDRQPRRHVRPARTALGFGRRPRRRAVSVPHRRRPCRQATARGRNNSRG